MVGYDTEAQPIEPRPQGAVLSGAPSAPAGGPAAPAPPNLAEFLWHVHGQLAEQIKFADQKAGFIAVLATGVMGALHSAGVEEKFTKHPMGDWGLIGWAGLLAFALFVGAVFFCFSSISPRASSKVPPGFIYWGAIAENETEQAFYQRLCSASSEELTEHLSNQTYVLAAICKGKYYYLSLAIAAAVAGSALGLIVLLLGPIGTS
jgi:Family of unknown function (DUF5706)